jgi:hypothetical protein
MSQFATIQNSAAENQLTTNPTRLKRDPLFINKY